MSTRASLLILSLAALASSATPDLAHLGPSVGDTMPDFSAPDQNGTVRSLASLLRSKGAIIVFYRSADW